MHLWVPRGEGPAMMQIDSSSSPHTANGRIPPSFVSTCFYTKWCVLNVCYREICIVRDLAFRWEREGR